jgi:hypothetical protein
MIEPILIGVHVSENYCRRLLTDDVSIFDRPGPVTVRVERAK